MILKIEMRHYCTPDPDLEAHGPGQNYSKHFAMIDGVEQVQFGECVPIDKIPHPMPEEDGTVTEVEMFLNEGMKHAPERPVELHLNLIRFKDHGRNRVVAAAGNVYLCNDQGDTLEIIRSYEYTS